MTIGIDVDGVLRDFIGSLTKVYKEHYPTHQVQPVTEWGIEHFFPIGKEIYKFAFDTHIEEIFGNAEAFPGAVEFMRRLNNTSHHIAIVTSQPQGKEDITVYWLRKHGIKYDSLHFASDKSVVDVDILLDDAIHNLDTTQGMPVAFSQPWNHEWDGFKVQSYDEFMMHIDRIGIEEAHA